MRRRILRGAAAIMVLAGTWMVAFAPAADAATLDRSGWWWARSNFNDAPPPPGLPKGGLYVAGAPDGAVAIAAVRYELDEFETAPELILEVAAGDSGSEEPTPTSEPAPAPAPAPVPSPDSGSGAPSPPEETLPVILACQTGSTWHAADAGASSTKPSVACGVGKMEGKASNGGQTWTWDLSSLQVRDKVDVVLVPGKVPDGPEGANGSTFQLTFKKPTDESLGTTQGAAPPPPIPGGAGAFQVDDTDSGSDVAAAPSSDSGSAGTDAGSSDFSSASDSGADSFDPGVDDSADGPALPEEDQGLGDDAPLAQSATEQAQAASNTETANGNRLLGGVIIAAGLALGFYAQQQQTPGLRKLGRFGAGEPVPATVPAGAGATATTPEQGGLGRFTRQRTSAAPKL